MCIRDSTNAQNTALNTAILNAIQRDLVMEWRQKPGAPYVKELVSVYTKLNGTIRTCVLYRTDSKYGLVSARSITDQVRAAAVGIRIADPEPVWQSLEKTHG